MQLVISGFRLLLCTVSLVILSLLIDIFILLRLHYKVKNLYFLIATCIFDINGRVIFYTYVSQELFKIFNGHTN